MITSWNAAEDLALQGLSLAAQLVYLRGLRRYMDYATGLVGVKRRVSYQGLLETISVEPDWGCNKRVPRPTRDKLRAVLDELKRHGLVADAGSSQRDGLRLRLLLADSDFSGKKRSTPGARQGEDVGENLVGAGVEVGGGPCDESMGKPMHPGSGNSFISLEARRRFAMTADWGVPAAFDFKFALIAGGRPSEAELNRFRSFHAGRGEFSQGQWVEKLLSDLKFWRGMGHAKRGGAGAAAGFARGDALGEQWLREQGDGAVGGFG